MGKHRMICRAMSDLSFFSSPLRLLSSSFTRPRLRSLTRHLIAVSLCWGLAIAFFVLFVSPARGNADQQARAILEQTGTQRKDDRGIVGDLPDVLAYDGDFIYMRHRAFNLDGAAQEIAKPHLHSPTGFLDDSWHERSFWVFAREFNAQNIGAYYDRAGRARFAGGRILVCDDTYVYGYGRNMYPPGRQTVGTQGGWCLFATTRVPKIDLETQSAELQALWKKWKGPKKALIDFRWREQIPLQVWGLVLADGVLFAAGPAFDTPSSDTQTTTQGDRGSALLWIASAQDGKRLATVALTGVPVWDGLAAANGQLYMTTVDGRLICLGGQ